MCWFVRPLALSSVEVDWTSCEPALSSRLSIPLRISPMTDVQWLRIRSFLSTGSGLRVGKKTHCRLCVEALRGMVQMGAPCGAVAGRVQEGELGLSPLGQRV